INISKFNPEGTRTGAFPFSSSLIPIRAVYLNVSGVDISPLSAEVNKKDLPVMTLKLKSTQDFIRVGQFNLYQTGTIEQSTPTGIGDGDFSGVSIWKDMDNDGSFSPLFDKRLGITYWYSTSTFKNGISVTLKEDELPYITVTTNTTILHILINTGQTDLSGSSIIGHKAGLAINNFIDIKGPNGLPLAAGQYFSDRYPISINQIAIVSGNIKLTPVYQPIILAPNGYPAYALVNSSGNIVVGSDGYPLPDESKWIYASTMTSCKPNEPLIDINGDGVPDNFDFFNKGKCVNISLNNSQYPSFDVDGDRIIDFETNLDYIPDKIVNNGWDEPLYFIGDRYQNQRLYYSVPQVGAVPTVWSSKTNELNVKWQPATTPVVRYELTVGENYKDVSGIKKTWDSVGNTLSGSVKNISLSPGNMTVLTSRITLDSSSFTVKDASNFAQEGVVYVGSEIMLVSKIDNQTFRILERGVQGSYSSMHTPWGEVVSDRGYIVSVRGVTSEGGYIPNENGTPVLIFRIDTTKPTTPGAPQPQVPEGVAAGQSYSLKWTQSTDPESNIMAYEIQERENTSPIWKTINGIPGYKYGGGINNLYTVGDPITPGETPRPAGNYYTYRIRAWNFAGLASDWSEVSKPAATSIGKEIIQKVDAYPNPVDLRKGGKEGKVTIAYILNDNAEVTISIYDLLGYLVKEIKISRGDKGAQMGSNYIEWNGKNDLGATVSKGGYIVRIKASSPKGSTTVTKKIGIIH
ncbi:MAG: FlgD immunoglobulin-like domain containing protein, partial [Elusimicrobiales bacterium]